MSDRRRRTIGPTGFSTTGRRTALGYWIPLAVTVTIATLGLAAWVWSERNDTADNDRDDDDNEEGREDGPITLDPEGSGDATVRATGAQPEDASMFARVLRRTPSPQQMFDSASRRVVAGMTAAGAVFGGALGAIREEGNGDFEDHSRWAEPSSPIVEDLSRTSHGDNQFTMSGALQQTPTYQPTKKTRLTVAIVVSSVSPASESGSIEDLSEHATILSRLPEYIEPESAKVFVLIYAPGVQSPPSGDSGMSSSRPALSVASSYDNIGREEATSPDSPNTELTLIDPQQTQEGSESTPPLFKALYSQAQVLVDKETMIMPFNTPNGHVHILRHLSPDIVYIQDSLSGDAGGVVQNISGWVRQVVIVSTGSASTSDEQWWRKEDALGRRTKVVDVTQIGDDWHHRVSRHN